MLRCYRIKCCILFVLIFLVAVQGKKKKPQKQSQDTSVFNFLRLVVFRLIYGFASMIGAEEGISEFMGGIFVPPAVENSDYRDYIDVGDDIDY